MRRLFLCIPFIMLIFSCSKNKETLFVLLDAHHTGVSFVNEIDETESYNLYDFEYIYNGGGIGILDINNDGLLDFIAGGNMVTSKLFLNKGNLQFEDITISSGLTTDRWISGISIIDINADGFDDIYLCVGGNKKVSNTENLLFINNHDNTFTESATQYGINDHSLTTQAAFFDYDLDGDLDLYLLNYGNQKWAKDVIYQKIVDGTGPGADKFFINNGNNTFTDRTSESGILVEGYGLGISVFDINKDKYPDIYISNDYLDDDILYINNRDGTFTDKISEYFKHSSFFAMGNDVGDINNDGREDIFSVDMLPESNERHKLFIGGGSYDKVKNRIDKGFMNAYVRNTLQLNNGDGFSEIGQYSGVDQTDWSWGPLLADFDNDGYKDLFVTNGYKKEITNLDVSITINLVNIETNEGSKTIPNEQIDKQRQKFLSAVNSMEENKLVNYIFRNNGDLTFEKVNSSWGINTPTFSNGAAYTDLDNDGDLDLIVNNINDPISIYQNTTNDQIDHPHFIRIRINKSNSKQLDIGAFVSVYTAGLERAGTVSPVKGFQSSVESILHFGIGNTTAIDSIQITWSDGKSATFHDVAPDQLFIPEIATNNKDLMVQEKSKQIFKRINNPATWKHLENTFIDFKNNSVLPKMLSREGPSLATGDLNGDGDMDFVLGGSIDQNTTLMLSRKNGFEIKELKKAFNYEDAGIIIFDVEMDGDNDIYISSGGVENEMGAIEYLDRLWINDGKGDFSISSKNPQLIGSKSCVLAADYDGDGDLDLFVGGRSQPGAYPMPCSSYLLQNNDGQFTNVTNIVLPELINLGMVTSAIWSDFNNDHLPDLIIAGEWMSIKFYQNTGDKFIDVSKTLGIDQYSGWWNSINGADIDNDGDIDYVIGNYGLNHRYNASIDKPLSIYAKDIDENGSIDPIIFCYHGDKLVPIHARDELIGKVIPLKKKFYSYQDYAESDWNDLIGENSSSYYSREVTTFESGLLINKGQGKFELKSLPAVAQLAPIYGSLFMELNGDDFLDLILVGNTNAASINDGEIDALNGLILLNDQTGGFRVSDCNDLQISGSAKSLVTFLDSRGNILISATQNNDFWQTYQFMNLTKTLVLKPTELNATIEFSSGSIRKYEYYFGNGYLSQSQNFIQIPPNSEKITIKDIAGESRTINTINL